MTITVSISFPRTDQRITGIWNPNADERKASWEMVVELSTRVPVIPLRQDEGLLREVLTSLYTLFAETRTILRSNGPALAENRRGELSFAVLAGHLVNQIIRPVLAYWHPALQDWEATRQPGEGEAIHERAWGTRYEALKTLLEELRGPLRAYAELFAEACDADEFLLTQLSNEGSLFEQSVRRAVRHVSTAEAHGGHAPDDR